MTTGIPFSSETVPTLCAVNSAVTEQGSDAEAVAIRESQHTSSESVQSQVKTIKMVLCNKYWHKDV